jgi:TetR/AcrR family transcriptional regulator, cholesterol catabolism regulator
VDEVMRVGLERTHTHVLGRLAALPASADPVARLRTAIEAHLVAVLQISDYASATIKLIGQVPAAIRDRQLAGERAYGALWRRLLEDGRDVGAIRPDVELSAIRMAILGALNWSVEWYDPAKASPQRLAEDMADMVLEGLAVGSARRRSARRRP